MIHENETCPQCHGEVTQEPVCPGYVDDGKWLNCYPACGNAFLYECTRIVCGWWFIDGMNPRHAMFAANEARRPRWLAK